jgi:ATP-dependent Zn protease
MLPENDRLSVTLKEYLAEIDVCMGGRVAEELSEISLLSSFGKILIVFIS